MERQDPRYDAYLSILQHELVPALGCTEPIALAYAAAMAVKILGRAPERILVKCSGNIVKNVKSVKVPNAQEMKGIQAASVLGALGGDSDRNLQVLEGISDADREHARALVKTDFCQVELLEDAANLHIITQVFSNGEDALVEIADSHTNIVRTERCGEILFQAAQLRPDQKNDGVRSLLSFDGILDFAESVALEDIQHLIGKQITCNTAISNEGMRHNWGVNAGRALLSMHGDSLAVRAAARAAAGSDARMSGCVLPVIINSGSGNQGMTVSLPIIEYAKAYGKTKEELYRSLVVANLLAIHQKTPIGKLSAYCGAVSAAAAAGVGIAYLMGADRQVMKATLANTLGNVAGVVCDGAKPSCAAKIASSVEAALFAYHMAAGGACFQPGEGLIKSEIERTILNYGQMASQGMRQTDVNILKLMLED